jgi:autotransporter-associated beta strand protein
MKTFKLSLCLLAALLAQRFAFADLVGPYTTDTNTLFLFHFDEAAGGTLTTNVGSKGGVAYSVNENPASATPPTVTTMLGATGYSTNSPTSISFNNCMTNPVSGYVFGYDFNNSGAYEGEGTYPAGDAMGLTNFNIGNGGQTPFTLEALIQPTTTAGTQEIICTDSSGTSRGFQFRINAGGLNFQQITSGGSVSGTIPTTGPDAFVPGAWYHVAATYDGTTLRLYWTRLDPSVGAAHLLNSSALAIGAADGAIVGTLDIGSDNRGVANEQFIGSIDEVRISSVARAANQMQFFSPLVTITQNPVSQNIDYNQKVTFSVGASSTTSLGYQWFFNSNSIAGATNSSYVITNVAAANGGYYNAIVTNTASYAATSSPALLIVGAANFLNHRYSFTTDTSDSIGTANGTNFGTAIVNGGALVLDGSSGCYMQLPGNLFNAANSTALTVEFWATYGANASNVHVFDFGSTNTAAIINSINYVGFSPHNGAGGQQIDISAGDESFQQTVTNSSTLDGLTVHIACVIDPPNQTLAIYTNGVLEAINTNMTVGIASLNDALSLIGGSLDPAFPYLNASIDELRLYNGALAGLSIKQSDDQGPNIVLADGPGKFVTQPAGASVPVGQTATLTAAAVGYLPINYQWFKNGTLISGATNASYSFQTVIGDNNSTFVCYATNIIGVTTYVTNSSTATLTVFLPPTLSWLGAADGGADNSWNTTSLDWTNDASGGGVIAFAQTNGVLFDDRSGGGSVDIASSIMPYNIAVNAASDYTLFSSANTGSLIGQGAITKLNSGTLIIDLTNNLTGGTTISGGELQVGNGDSFGTLGSGPVTNNATLSLNRGDTALNVANAIHGSGTVSFDGYGDVTVSGASDYTGNTLVNAGIVYLQNSSGLGATSGGTSVADGAQLYITANVNVAEGLTLNGSGPDGNGALRKGGAGLTTDNGAVTLASDSTIGVDSGATLTLSNTVSGAAMLTVNGGGTLALNHVNTYSGGTMLSAGVIDLNANGALGTGTVTAQSGGVAARFVLADGLTITNPFVANDVSPSTLTGFIMVNDNTNGTVTTVSGPLEFDAAAANGGDFVGPTSSGYLNVTGPVTNTVDGVVSSRIGLVRFSGGGEYTTFNLNQGTASLGANNGLSTDAALVVAASGAATFDLNGFNQTLAGLSDGATNPELVTNSAASPSTLTLNLSAGSTYSGVIAGNVALVVNGSGSLYLAGTNTYTDNTTVNGVTLELAQPSLAANSTVTVAGGAVLQLDFPVTNSVAGLVLNGVSQGLGVYNSTTSPSYITGSGSLQVAVTVATNPTNIVASVSGNNLNLSWPADHIGWTLLMQTNNLARGISSNTNDWGAVSGSAGTNRVNLTIDPTKPAEFYRLVYP